MTVKHGPCLLTLKKRIQAFETKRLGKLFCISYWEQKPNDWVRSKNNFLVGPQEPLLSTNCQETETCMVRGMSHAPTASPKPYFRASCRVSVVAVGRGNAEWATSKSGHPCPCKNCSQGRPAEKTGSGSLLNRAPCPPFHTSPDDPIGQETELNWSEQPQGVTSGRPNTATLEYCIKYL